MRFAGRVPRFVPSRRFSLALASLLGLALAAVLLAGCSGLRDKPDPYVDIRASWRDGYGVPDERLALMPFYSITARIDPASGLYTGTLDLELPISTTRPIRDLYFRIYPRLLVFDGDLKLTGAWVDDATVSYMQEADGTALRLDLVDPLRTGMRPKVRLAFHGKFETARSDGTYTIFGKSEDVLSLTNFYPILSGRRNDDWALDLPHPQGDVAFQEASLYRVTLTVPAGQTIVATGAEISRTVAEEGWETVRYAIGPAREFTVLMSPSLHVTEDETLGTRVRSYYYEPDLGAARQALLAAKIALQIYSDSFGRYPYRDLSIVEAPLTYHGMEFPGIALIGSQDYTKYPQDLENLVVHEVAHQWWYNQVGSDQVVTPWLDEGLAEYSMYVYYLGRYGAATAEGIRTLRWQVPVNGLKVRGKDRPIGLPVVEYDDESYETLVYGKGALFFAALRDRLGPVKFDKFLRDYVSQQRWRIASESDMRRLAESIAGEDLGAFFDEWVRH